MHTCGNKKQKKNWFRRGNKKKICIKVWPREGDKDNVVSSWVCSYERERGEFLGFVRVSFFGS